MSLGNMKNKWLLIIVLFTWSITNAQETKLSPQAEISVLTIGPGTSLNDSFGHSAFRIADLNNDLDLVFNYGIYDFDTPNFYVKFAQGKLNYLMGLNYYDDFLASYMAQNRNVQEQILNLNAHQKQKLFDYLLNNYQPENRAYLYDFFYDNCATRIRDVVDNVMHDDIVFNTPKELEEKTFRTLIHENLNKNSWGSMGIDLALGSVIDKKAVPREYMFLPKFIFLFFENATINKSQSPLVKETNLIYEKAERRIKNSFITSPLIVFGLMSLIIIVLTYSDYKKNKRTIWLDMFLFSATGLIGIVILLLWFATDHKGTANNYNILWAFALNLLVLGQAVKKVPKNWFVKYLKFLLIMLCLLTLHWFMGVQVFAITLIPIFAALAIRYVFLLYHFKNQLS